MTKSSDTSSGGVKGPGKAGMKGKFKALMKGKAKGKEAKGKVKGKGYGNQEQNVEPSAPPGTPATFPATLPDTQAEPIDLAGSSPSVIVSPQPDVPQESPEAEAVMAESLQASPAETNHEPNSGVPKGHSEKNTPPAGMTPNAESTPETKGGSKGSPMTSKGTLGTGKGKGGQPDSTPVTPVARSPVEAGLSFICNFMFRFVERCSLSGQLMAIYLTWQGSPATNTPASNGELARSFTSASMISDGGGPVDMNALGQVGDDGKVRRVRASTLLSLIYRIVNIYLSTHIRSPFQLYCTHYGHSFLVEVKVIPAEIREQVKATGKPFSFILRGLFFIARQWLTQKNSMRCAPAKLNGNGKLSGENSKQEAHHLYALVFFLGNHQPL